MLNRKVIHLFVLASCLSFWGCSHRFDRFGFFKPKSKTKVAVSEKSNQNYYSLRLIATNLKHDKAVLKEDANNFSTFFLEQLVKDRDFSVELSPDAIQQFDSLANQANPDLIRDLGKKYKVEALVRGRVKDYSYKLGRREFKVSLDLEIEGINTHNSTSFFSFDKKFQRSFRLRGRRQRDMSSYNLRFLSDVMKSIKDSFNEQFEPIVLAQKSRHGGLIPTRVIADDAGPGPHSREELMNVYLWPVSQNGQDKIGPQPLIIKSNTTQLASVNSQKSEELRNAKSSDNLSSPSQDSLIDPEELMLQSAREAEQRLSQTKPLNHSPRSDRIDHSSEIEGSNEMQLQYDSSLDLQMSNFQLVYPEMILANKQYQKLYYLLEDESKQLSALDLESSNEEVLELEIFNTHDRTAVKKFLDDYFHGIYPAPRGKIPAVFERYYLGKLQLGFVLGNQAFIASTHRNNRDILDNAIQNFYTNNGGVTVAKILDTSIKKRRLDTIVFAKPTETKYLPQKQELVQESFKPRLHVEDVKINKPEVMPRTQVANPMGAKGVYRSSIEQPKLKTDVNSASPANPGALEYEDGSIRNPFGHSDKKISTGKLLDEYPLPDQAVGSDLSKNVRFTNNYSRDDNDSKSEQVEISSNAGFYYDIGRRYFISSQYELSKRYMKLAHENGYRSEELTDYLTEIEKRLNPVTYTAAQSQVFNQDLGDVKEKYESGPQKSSPAVNSGVLDFDTASKSRNISSGSQNQRDRALEEFYSEMDKMEAELRQYTKNKRQLSTSANGKYRSLGMAELAFQILAIVALVLFFLSFLSSRRITASPIHSDLSKDVHKNS